MAAPAPVPAVMQKQFTNMYSEELCGCASDPQGAVMGLFCTPCVVGQIVADAKQGDCVQTAAMLSVLMAVSAWVPCIMAGVAFKQAEFVNNSMQAYGVTEKVDCLGMCCIAPLLVCRADREAKSRKAAGILPVTPQAVVYATGPPQQQIMMQQQPVAAAPQPASPTQV